MKTQKIRKLKKPTALWRQAPGDLQKWLWLLSTGAGRRVYGARRQHAARLCSSGFLCRFCGKICFEGYLTWIVFVFKLNIFKNNGRFGFILKDLF
jgi:hypothetical protein